MHSDIIVSTEDAINVSCLNHVDRMCAGILKICIS